MSLGDSILLRERGAPPPSLPVRKVDWMIRSASAAVLSIPGHDARSAWCRRPYVQSVTGHWLACCGVQSTSSSKACSE